MCPRKRKNKLNVICSLLFSDVHHMLLRRASPPASLRRMCESLEWQTAITLEPRATTPPEQRGAISRLNPSPRGLATGWARERCRTPSRQKCSVMLPNSARLMESEIAAHVAGGVLFCLLLLD